MNGRNVLIGALQTLRSRANHFDSAAGQADIDHALLVVDAYCNEQKQAALTRYAMTHVGAIAVATSQLEAGDWAGTLKVLRVALDRCVKDAP